MAAESVPDPQAEPWRERWEQAVAELAEARAENLRLRDALDDLNSETEQILNDSVTGTLEDSGAHLIEQLESSLRSKDRRIAELEAENAALAFARSKVAE